MSLFAVKIQNVMACLYLVAVLFELGGCGRPLPPGQGGGSCAAGLCVAIGDAGVDAGTPAPSPSRCWHDGTRGAHNALSRPRAVVGWPPGITENCQDTLIIRGIVESASANELRIHGCDERSVCGTYTIVISVDGAPLGIPAPLGVRVELRRFSSWSWWTCEVAGLTIRRQGDRPRYYIVLANGRWSVPPQFPFSVSLVPLACNPVPGAPRIDDFAMEFSPLDSSLEALRLQTGESGLLFLDRLTSPLLMTNFRSFQADDGDYENYAFLGLPDSSVSGD